jgi:hypothetical protein
MLKIGRVKHNTDPSPNTLWGQVSCKLTLYNTITSMGSAYTSPVYSEFGSILTTGGGNLGNVCDTLSEVELGIFFRVKALDFD